MKKIGYLILAHADPKHLERLVNAINYNASFLIHIDAKADIKEFQKLSLPQNVIFIRNRVRVAWGGISMVDATLHLIEEALKSGEDFSHLVLLSGSDYPLQKGSIIYDKFVNNPHHEFIKYIDMRESDHYIKQINQKWFKEPLIYTSNNALKYVDKTIRNIGNSLRLKSSWNKEIVPYFGSQWLAITTDCALYILKFVKDNPEYHKNNRHTFSPDEHFFHTIIGNSPYKNKSDGLQLYEGRGTWRLANLHVIHSSLAKWYSVEDWNEIKSSNKLFIRKVNSAISSTLLDLIDDKIS